MSVGKGHHDPNESKQAWEDRLSDAALREVVGGEQPPDLTERIVAAAAAEGAEKMAEDKETTTKFPPTSILRRRLTWLLATAAMLMVASLFILPGLRSARQAKRVAAVDARRTGESNELMSRASHDRRQEDSRKVDQLNTPKAVPNETGTGEELGQVVEAERYGLPSSQAGQGAGLSTSDREELYGRFEGGGRFEGTMRGEGRRTMSRVEGSVDGRRGGYLAGGYEGEFAMGDQALAYPAREEWEALTRRRKKYATVDLSEGDLYGHEEVPSRTVDVEPTRRAFEMRLRQLRELERQRGFRRDRYAAIHENPFVPVKGEAAVSTFSIDVDTASYTNVRQYLMQSNQLPPHSAVRIEEMINYFDYNYDGPEGNSQAPFAAHIELARCPWQPGHRIARVALKGREIDSRERPVSNLVFLVDVSGSMNRPNKLPLVVDGLRQLTHELGENDRVAIVVYASAQGLALPSTPGTDKDTILGVLDRLNAGGSTAGGAGIELAYQIARDNFIAAGVNRVILCTDGDFNVGVSDTAGLQRLAERQAQEANVFLTVLGYGRGNLNDEMMETISNKGNGNYHYIDNSREARKVLIEEMSGTLVTIAKDVKIQIEFNPAHVAAYRLIGYENRVMAREDFDDDTKDAGEIGAGHSVTALYELVPGDMAAADTSVEPLKYQDEPSSRSQEEPVDAEGGGRLDDELFTLRLRYKKPDGDTSTKLEFVARQNDAQIEDASSDFQFAAAVASFGMLLRGSEHGGDATFESVVELAAAGRRNDPHGYRSEFVDLVRKAQELSRR